MCEVGVWKSYEDIEDSLTLDELYLLYEQTTDRQQRLMKTVAAAFGATTDDNGHKDGDQNFEYTAGEIRGEGSVMFGYKVNEAEN